MEGNQTKDKVHIKNTDGMQTSEKINVDNSVSKVAPKPLSNKGSESEPEPKEGEDIQHIDPETQSRLKAFLEVAGVKLSHVDARTFQDPEILRKLTNSVSNALDEAATALNRMRSKQGGGDEPHRNPPPTEDIDVTTTTTNNQQQESLPVGGGEVSKGDKNNIVHPNKQQPSSDKQQDVTDLQALQHLLGQGHGIHETAEDGESLLSLACSAGYFELAEVLLRMRASVEDRGIKGDSTPLMEAASGGYADIVKLLIDHGANVNATSSVGNTALTYACCGGFVDVVRILLDNGALVEHQNENGHTPLMEAASCGHVGVAKVLLEYGANINTHSNEFKESALTLACYKGHLDMVKFLLGAGADQDHKTDEMHTALMEACMDGHVEVARLLLDHGAQVNMPVDSFESPLTLAACGGHFELTALLLSRGADLEEVNDEGYTPLMEAAREGHEDVVQLLVDHGANINAQTEETQETALTLACCGGFLEVAQYLVDHGADIEVGASTPLMEASQEGHIEIVKYLIEKGANIHALTNTMDTSLTCAAANGHTNIVKLLLECGAVLEHESEGGRTPLMKAARAGHMETVQFLMAHGADSNRITVNNDHTVLSLACAGGHVGIVKYLLVQGADSGHILKDNSTMLIEAARGGHSSVVCLLLQQPKFTAALRSQIAQQLSSRCTEQITSIAGKRRARGSHPGGRGKKQVKSPIPDGTGTDNTRKGGQHVLPNGPQQYQQPLLCHHAHPIDPPEMTPPPDMTPPKKSMANHKDGTTITSDNHHDKMTGSIMWSRSNEDRTFEPSEFTVNPSYKFGQVTTVNPDGTVVFPATATGPQGTFPTTGSPGSYLLPPIFAQSPAYSNQEHMEAYMKADEILRNHMLQLDYAKQQALMNALESLMLQSEAHRASIGVGGGGGKEGERSMTPSPVVGGLLSETGGMGGVKPSSTQTTPFKANGSNKNGKGSEPVPIKPEVPVTSQSTTPTWSFTDPSRMPQFSIGVSTLAPSGNSPEKQSPKSSHHPSPGKHTSLAEKQAFASRVASRLEQVNKSPSGPTPSADYYSTTPVTQFFNAIDKQSSFHPPLVYNNSPTKFNFGASVEVTLDETGSTSSVLSGSPGNRTREASPFATPIPSTVTTTTTTTVEGAATLNQLPPVPKPQYLQPVYSPDLPSLKHLSHHRIHPVGGVATADLPPPQHFDANGRPTPMTSSVWLDANFPLDIPPPSDLIPEHLHHMIPGGYSGHQLESDSLSSSLEGGLEDEDELEEALALHPDLSSLPPGSYEPSIDIDQQTDSNHDTALTLAAAGGHDDLVELLLERGSDLEHRDKKGCTPIILAANAGHAMTVAILLEHNADMESQTDRTKDTALSLACSSGRQEVVELLLAKGANFEHRNVSDYTPLSLAASGGYVAIIKMLLKAGADINSRTGSKLGISPLMLAAMNGHTTTVKLLLDCGSDINAQIETNRNTALTLACFQGRHEVVNLLVERQANVEHRAKTGLTPLMEAASGGYHEVGMVLINKGADVNAAPVPSSRDTALTIAADKGHYKFVDLLLRCNAFVDVRNKKGNSPLWLSANGGHLDVTRLLIENKADVDSQDNRKVSCLMAAFRKGHYKVVRYLVEHVSQFPSDADLNRYINTLSDKELIKKSQRCMEVIIHAKERQAAEANKNASILLQELDQERQHEENRKAAIARKRARKKKQKEKKKAQEKEGKPVEPASSKDGMDDIPTDSNTSDKENIDKRQEESPPEESLSSGEGSGEKGRDSPVGVARGGDSSLKTVAVDVTHVKNSASNLELVSSKMVAFAHPTTAVPSSLSVPRVTTATAASLRSPARSQPVATSLLTTPTSSPRRGKKEEGWKEVGKRAKKISVPSSKFGQVVGRNSSNLTLIKSHTGASIEIEKSNRQAPTRTLLVKGSHESIRQSQQCITALQRDSNCDLLQLLQVKLQITATVNTTSIGPLDSIQSPLPESSMDQSWKMAGKPLTTSISATAISVKPKPSQSAPDVTNSMSSLSRQTASQLKSSRSAIGIERKGSASSLTDNRSSVRSSASVTCVPPVSGTPSWVHSTHTPSALPTPKSGAVRQLFTSNATSNQVTNTNSVTCIKMSPVAKPLLNNPAKLPGSSSWKQINTVAPPILSVPSTSDERPTRQQVLTGNRTLPVSSKSAFQVTTASSVTNVPMTTREVGMASRESNQNVFEQILKTPSLFAEMASQIAQPKKYSDAVGKKPSLISDGPIPAPVKPLAVATGNNASNHAHLINKAPGTKPVAMEQQIKHSMHDASTTHQTGVSQQRRTSPWNEDLSNKEGTDFTGDNVSPGSGLGPIAPPSRSSKSSAVSPKGQPVPSPQRLLHTPPVAKSPLLGPAPPGLLPLPDKTIFRPIHPEGSELPNIVPTQMPTPVRNSRPPLLATPPGFPSQLMQSKNRSETGKRSPLPKRMAAHLSGSNIGSPFQGVPPPDIDSMSPTKSPSQQQLQQQSLGQMLAFGKPSSNFNPNAPSFIPMGMPQGQIAQTTSSILGNPPSNLKYSLPVPISSSILGTAPPQLQTTMGGLPPQQTMTPPTPINASSHPPPPPIPPPPPPIIFNSQPSLLGNPPFPLLVPQTGQSVQAPPPPPPQAPPTRPPMFYGGNQYETNALPPPPLMPNNHFTAHPVPTREVMSDQFPPPPSDNPQVFGFPSPNFPIDGLAPPPQVTGEGDPVGLAGWTHHFGGQNLIGQTSGFNELGVMNIVGGGDSGDPELSFPHPDGSTPGPVAPPLMSSSRPVKENTVLSMDTDPKAGLSAFSVLSSSIGAQSSLWAFTPPTLGLSEESGWTKPGEGVSTGLLGYMSSDWPVMSGPARPPNDPPSLSDSTYHISLQDDLQTVLEKLGLGQYYHTFQKNYIDRSALMLMSEEDFTEVGIPKGPRIKLLSALGRYVGRSDPSNQTNNDSKDNCIDEEGTLSSINTVSSSVSDAVFISSQPNTS